MEGKDEEDDTRASPLDFLSASTVGAVFQPHTQYQQQQRHWTRSLTTSNEEASSATQRLEQTISPPTIPRDTNIFAEGQRQITSSGDSWLGNNSAAGTTRSTNMMPRRNPSSPAYTNFGIAPTNTQEFSAVTSAFRRAQDVRYHGRIPAYGTLEEHHQHRISSSSSSFATAVGAASTASYESSSGGSAPQQLRRPILNASTHTGPLHHTSTSLSISYPLQELSFTRVPSPHENEEYSPSSSRSQYWSQSPSARTINTMGSIDESTSTTGIETATNPRDTAILLQPMPRRIRERSRATPSGSGQSSSRKLAGDKCSVMSSSTEHTTESMSPPPSRDAGSKSPPSQNLRGDPFRSAKVKTELCRNYYTPRGCPFGDKCNYAHGEHELKFTKLVDLERAGLVDIEIFRTHPCPTWVATGACPFDQRCIGLHDPRVGGSASYPAWLPHAETMINKVANGVNVDNFYHDRVAYVYNHCPVYGFVPIVDENADDFKSEASFKNFYEFICNVDRLRKQDISPSSERSIDEETMLEIVLDLRQGKVGASYSYMPTHMLNSELCMVLQAKTFQSRVTRSSTVILEEVEEESPTTAMKEGYSILVHEIAFGPVGDPTVRPVSIWFDIKEGELVECTSQQAKHHKRSRHRLKKKTKSASGSTSSSRTIHDDQVRNTEPFDHYQPRDKDAFNLVTDTLRLRLKSIKAFGSNFDAISRRRTIQYLEDDMEAVKFSYFRQLKYWVTWSWPEQVLQDAIRYDTDVPPVDGEYDCYVHDVSITRGEKDCDDHALGTKRFAYNLSSVIKCLPSFIWKSFIINMQVMVEKPLSEIRRSSSTVDDKVFFNLNRLPILKQLSMGRQIARTRGLPHISNVASQSNESVENLFNHWDETRIHYKANIENAPPKLAETDKGAHETMSQSLDALAKHERRAL